MTFAQYGRIFHDLLTGTLLKSTKKVHQRGIQTRIFGFPDRCSNNWAIGSTEKQYALLIHSKYTKEFRGNLMLYIREEEQCFNSRFVNSPDYVS